MSFKFDPCISTPLTLKLNMRSLVSTEISLTLSYTVLTVTELVRLTIYECVLIAHRRRGGGIYC